VVLKKKINNFCNSFVRNARQPSDVIQGTIVNGCENESDLGILPSYRNYTHV